MKQGLDRSIWTNYLNEFTRRNQSRMTRLEVFGENGAQEEEHGLPFAGITLEQVDGVPSIEIMFGAGVGHEPQHLTRVIANVKQIMSKRGPDDRDEALEIIDADGEMNLLRFDSAQPDLAYQQRL